MMSWNNSLPPSPPLPLKVFPSHFSFRLSTFEAFLAWADAIKDALSIQL
jgi:hypothetical protein